MKHLFKLFIVFFTLFASFESIANEKEGNWFITMLNKNTSTSQENWDKEQRIQTWQMLRISYPSHQNLMEMSWEERDKIWDKTEKTGDFETLAKKYKSAYLVSCKERGTAPKAFDTARKDLSSLQKLREIYLASRQAEYVILTPKAPKEPQINSSKIYGVRPGHELIYRVAVSGEMPLTINILNSPKGLSFDKATNVLRGKIAKKGDYTLTITAKNKFGSNTQDVLIKVGEEIALTPPLGWNSWNSFACDVTATDIKNTAQQLVKTGLVNYGWSYINIDDCWMKMPDVAAMPEGKQKADRIDYYSSGVEKRKSKERQRFNEEEVIGATRNDDGNVLSNKDFAMKPLTDYLHNLGFKAGLYTSPGPLTCQRYEGSYEHEQADANQYAAWGFDYLKHDWCGYSGIVKTPTVEDWKKPYALMGKALRNTNRDILYSICQYGRADVWKWGESVGGNAWRTTGDIRDTWERMSKIGFSQAGLEEYAGPGHWNDPDMLVVGYVGWSKNLRPTYLSPNEQYTHISLWSILNSPLLIGCDLTKLDDFTFGLLANPEVIALNQDVLGKQASRIIETGGVQVWTKALADGSIAVGIFNLGEEPVNYKLNFADLKLAGKQTVRNVWTREDKGVYTDAVDAKINRHGVQLYKLSVAK